MDFLKINGSHGEGGGQIIRSAITLSCITKKPIHLENIRMNRKISGLKPQHLTAIKILQKIANAKVVGAEIGSTELKFIPGKIKNLDLVEDVGTAGSIPLILQVLLREAYSRMGINFSFQLIKRGYYPKGNGKIKIKIEPSKMKSIIFSKRKTKNVKIICSFSKLETDEIKNKINEIKIKLTNENFIVDVEIKSEEALDSGASLLIYSIDDDSIIGIDALYNKKTHEFDLDIDDFIESYSIDENLADMLIVPASLGTGKTIFQVKEITSHLETNLFVTSKITGCKYGIGKTSYGYDVIVEGILNSSIK